jgi:hypothetical protein
LPTPGGPTIVTRRGGGSSGRRSTRGTCRRFSLTYIHVRNPMVYLPCKGTESRTIHHENAQQSLLVVPDWRNRMLWDYGLSTIRILSFCLQIKATYFQYASSSPSACDEADLPDPP